MIVEKLLSFNPGFFELDPGVLRPSTSGRKDPRRGPVNVECFEQFLSRLFCLRLPTRELVVRSPEGGRRTGDGTLRTGLGARVRGRREVYVSTKTSLGVGREVTWSQGTSQDTAPKIGFSEPSFDARDRGVEVGPYTSRPLAPLRPTLS